MKTYHIIGAVPDGFDSRAHPIKLDLDPTTVKGQTVHDWADAWSIKLTSREVRMLGRKGIQLIIP